MADNLGKIVLDSSSSSVVEGNSNSSTTKQIAPSKRWLFVLNNWTEEEYSSIVLISKKYCSLIIIGDEVGEQGTPHLQGYFELKDKARPISVFQNKRIHFIKCKGTRDDNIKYCSKEKVKYSYGVPKPLKIITELRPFQQRIIDIISEEPDDRVINWFWDEDGNIGKTSLLKYCIVHHNALPCIGGKFSDIMNLIFNNDMDMCSVVMFNIPRANKGCVSYASLEAIKDGLIVNTKYETGHKIFNPPHIIVFANFPPSCEEELSADRWKVVEIKSVNDNAF